MTDPQTGGTTDGGQPHPASPPATLITDTSVTGGSGTDGGQPHPADEPTK